MKLNGFKNGSINKIDGKISWDKAHDSTMVTLLAILQLSDWITLQGKWLSYPDRSIKYSVI